MKKTFKTILICLVAALSAAVCIAFSACMAVDGKDGRDGNDLDIYDVYDATNAARAEEGLERLTFLEFIEQYFSGYISDEAQSSAALQSVMNYSLLSSVAIISEFSYSSSGNSYSSYAGSGVIVDIDRDAGDAYIVTNAHVLSDSYGGKEYYCNDIYIYLYGNDSYYEDFWIDSYGRVVNVSGIEGAEIVGYSAQYDLAVLRVEDSAILRRSSAVAAQFSESDVVYAGESVYAVGNPGGEGISVTKGIISRESETISLEIGLNYYEYRVIRTDASVNGGNSGGGLFDSSGQIIGIVNSKVEAEGVDNMAYALPSSYARRVVQSMIDNYEQNGAAMYVKTAKLGITVSSDDIYSYYDAANGCTAIEETVSVQTVTPNTAAFRLLLSGDVIKSISVGTLDSAAGNSGFTSQERSEYFEVPQDTAYRVARHYFTEDITRSYMIFDILFSVRKGDALEVVAERDGQTVYVYILFSQDSYFSYYY